MSDFARRLDRWRQELPSEIAFWEGLFATGGGDWTEEWARRRTEREIDAWLLELLPDPAAAAILDVGAGPLTHHGALHGGRRLNLTACDPLAPAYARLAARYGVRPPVETVFGMAEILSAVFEPGAFDLVTCNNALDHAFDPVRGIEEMLIVTRLGGQVCIGAYRNEGMKAGYGGLHGWNFDEHDGRCVLWNEEQRLDLGDRFAGAAELRFHAVETWITIFLTKTAEPRIDPATRSPPHDELRNAVLAWLSEDPGDARPS